MLVRADSEIGPDPRGLRTQDDLRIYSFVTHAGDVYPSWSLEVLGFSSL